MSDKVSIVTIVYNDVHNLEKTIQSVLSQTYKNIEYIIIDGGSTDGTVDIIKKYEDKISYWISEKDKGIYDAMNKGLEVFSGDWVNFMNSGDGFFDNNVLEDVFVKNLHNISDSDIIYGNHEVVYPNRRKRVNAGNLNFLWKGAQFSHQSAFFSKKFHKKNKFSLKNKIASDFDIIYEAYKNGVHFKYLDMYISSISAGGLSDKNRLNSIWERWRIVDKNFKVNIYYTFVFLKEVTKIFIKKILRFFYKKNN